jgi:hypothetical protein
MKKRPPFVPLEIADDQLERIIAGVRDSLMREFWGHISDGEQRARIRARLEASILEALRHLRDEIEAT